MKNDQTLSGFNSEQSEEILERIADAMWNRSGKDINFLDMHQINACNHIGSGTIMIDNTEYGFIIEMGDINGCLVHEWGLVENVGIYEPPPLDLWLFIPDNPFLHIDRPEMFGVYLSWRKEKWFQEKESAFNYDMHFQPGSFVRNHYKEWCHRKGLQYVRQSELKSPIDRGSPCSKEIVNNLVQILEETDTHSESNYSTS